MNESQPNWPHYLQSLADELVVQSRRIRSLIGDSHWLSDGHHKEYLLLSLLKRHLPAGIVASRGFVISPTNQRQRSTEQDILLVDTSVEAPIFHQSDIVVTLPSAVVASISVKTEMNDETIKDTVVGLASVSKLLGKQNCWLGGYWFTISNPIKNNAGKVVTYKDKVNFAELQDVGKRENCFAGAGETLFKLNSIESKTCVKVYNCEGMATGFFLANLLDFVADFRGKSQTQLAELADFEAKLVASDVTHS